MSEQIIDIDISEEMRDSYMDYAMSVIAGRALPNVRDGLKSVHRRILFSMNEQGNDYNKPYRKSARVVGDVIGKYHPHGELAVYDAIVRLTQSFSMRYQLIDGQGNFGSIDGDSPAAMRYTEVRMKQITSELLADLNKNTVDFTPNYDESEKEPTVLPSKIPTLLLNGSTGIAVGMASNIPPHNLNEVMNAFLYYIDNRHAPDLWEIMKIMPGPDFPTGGTIMGTSGIYSAYSTGRGIIKIRAKTHLETEKERSAIIVTELPYMVNKATLLEKIAGLARDKKLEGISDLRDESDRDGMRIFLQLKRGENPQVVLSNLYKQTAMQSSFGVIMLAIVDRQPKILPIIQVFKHFLDHRFETITRRVRYDLQKVEAHAHILLGLSKALEHLQEVIDLIQASANQDEAKQALHEQFDLSQKQSQAILEMRLQRLTGLERQKIADDLAKTEQAIKELRAILADDNKVFAIIREESLQIIAKYGVNDSRRSQISMESSDISIEELIDCEDVVVTISRSGYVKRSPVNEYRVQSRGGKGRIGMATKDEDFVEKMFVASTHDVLLSFTTLGRVFAIKVYEIPPSGPNSRGKAIVNLLQLEAHEKICAYLNISNFEEGKYIVLGTSAGICKKTALVAFKNIRNKGLRAINLDEDDTMISAQLTDGSQEIFISTRNGFGIRFPENNLRPLGRVSRGVKGIRLRPGDSALSMRALTQSETILTVTEKGFGKRSHLENFTLQKRGGMGVMILKSTNRSGKVVGASEVTKDTQVLLITKSGKLIRISASQIRVIGRVTQGVKLIDIDSSDRVIDFAIVPHDEDKE